MSFFKRHPRFWITIWAVFGLGGLVMAANAVFGAGFDAALLVKGLIGAAVSGIMVSYLLPELRSTNA